MFCNGHFGVHYVRMYGFKLEGGKWFKEGFRKLLSLEWNYFEKTWFKIQFSKNKKQFSTAPEKQSVVSQKQSVVYTSSIYKLNLKCLRDREIEHTGLYWFTLNQELHPFFPETIGETTKQSTLYYLQHHQRSDLDPLMTHTSFGSAQTPLRMLILTTSRTHNTS